MKRLAYERIRMGLSQNQLCKRLGIDRSYYNKVENGQKEAGKTIQMKLELLFSPLRWEYLNGDRDGRDEEK